MAPRARMILPTGKNNSAGFTLVELLLVLLLIAIIGGMSMSALPHGSGNQLKGFAKQMMVDFRLAQTMAIEQGLRIQMHLDENKTKYVMDVAVPKVHQIKERMIPDSIRMEMAPEVLVFAPDGSSTETVIKISKETTTLRITNGMLRFGWTVEEDGEVLNEES